MGRIIDVGPDWAKVQAIIADNASVSGMVLSSSDNLIVSGNLELYNQGFISFSKLVDDVDRVRIGDKIVTSNISDKYLPGILIGYISTIDDDSNNLTKSGTLTPAVDFAFCLKPLSCFVIANNKALSIDQPPIGSQFGNGYCAE